MFLKIFLASRRAEVKMNIKRIVISIYEKKSLLQKGKLDADFLVIVGWYVFGFCLGMI